MRNNSAIRALSFMLKNSVSIDKTRTVSVNQIWHSDCLLFNVYSNFYVLLIRIYLIFFDIRFVILHSKKYLLQGNLSVFTRKRRLLWETIWINFQFSWNESNVVELNVLKQIFWLLFEQTVVDFRSNIFDFKALIRRLL